MPTEAEITAAHAALLYTYFNASARDLAAAVLTAAEEVRGQVSGEDAELLDHVQFLCEAPDCRPYGAPTGETLPQADLQRLLALARRGAGQAVPDEEAIRADERERCAKIAEGTIAFDIDMWIGSTKESIAEATADAIASAIRAAAPKPEDKP